MLPCYRVTFFFLFFFFLCVTVTLLTHNREYWNAVSVVCRRLYRIIFISLDFWTLIMYKFLKLITSVRVTVQLNLLCFLFLYNEDNFIFVNIYTLKYINFINFIDRLGSPLTLSSSGRHVIISMSINQKT